MRRQSSWAKGFLRWFWILAVGIWGAWACTASPPAGIPAPVSRLLSVSNPDASGAVVITGAPGSVLGGATVEIGNLDQGAVVYRLQKVLLASAWAQVAPVQDSTRAAADGSFQLVVSANVDEVLRVVQEVDGERSPPTDLIVTGTVVFLGPNMEPKDVAADAEGRAFVSARSTTSSDGHVFLLNFGQGAVLNSVPQSNFVFPDFNGIGQLDLDLLLQTGIVVSSNQDQIRSFPFSGQSPASTTLEQPLDVSVLSSQGILAVGQGDANHSVSLLENSNGQLLCEFLFSPPTGTANPLQTPRVILGENGEGDPFLQAVIAYDDGSYFAGRFPVDASCTPGGTQVLLPQGIRPGALVAYEGGTKALVTDRSSDKLYDVDFVNFSVTAIVVGNNPAGLAIDEAQGLVYVVNSGDNSLLALNLEDFTVVQLIERVGLGPTEIALLPGFERAVVVSGFDHSVVLVDLDF